MSNAHDFVTSFMKNLAGEVELTEALQTVFAKILAAQVTVDDANVVSFKPAFSTLLKVLTFIATPQDERPEATSDYTQEAFDAAANSAATEMGLTIDEEPTDPSVPGESFRLTADVAEVDEGGAVNFTIAAAEGEEPLAEGTEVAYTLSGVDAADIDGDLTGTAVIGADGTATVTVNLTEDQATEGAETLTMSLDGTSVSSEVTVNDTSLAPTFELTAAQTEINEDGSITFTVTANEAVAAATDVVFTLVPGSTTAADQGTDTTNLNDFGQGAFNPVTVTIPVNGTTATFTITPPNDDKVELAESFSVQAVVAGTTLTKTATLLDGTSGGGKTFTLTAGADPITGTAGNDTINALTIKADGTAATTLSAFDVIDGGAGTDTLNIYSDGTSNITLDANTTIKNVENINIYNSTAAFNSTAAPAAIDASKLVGVKNINQIGLDVAVTNLGDDTVAAYKGGTVAASVLSVTSTNTATKAAVALDGIAEGDTITFNVPTVAPANGGALNSITVSGTVADTNLDGTVANTNVIVTAGRDVETLAVNSAVATTLTFTDGAGTKKVGTINAAASTGAITYADTETTVANISTGSGNDTVTLITAYTATLTAATVNGGEGDDTLNVNVTNAVDATGTTVSAVGGAGKDTINLNITNGATKAVGVTVDAGDGDDTVDVNYDVKTTDSIDGGAGTDTVALVGKAARNADDFIVINKVLKNFETIKFKAAEGAVGTELDASLLASNYTTLDFFTGSFVDNVGSQSLVARGALNAEAAGYKSALETAAAGGASAITYAGTLNITEKLTGAVQAHAETVNLTVEGGKASGVAAVVATLTGEAKTATVSLSAGTDTKGTVSTADDVYVASQVIVTNVAAAAAEGLSALTSLTLSGNGTATITNADTTALVTVDASALNSVDITGKAATGLVYVTTNTKAETIKLGAGLDSVTITDSTYTVDQTKMDTVEGLNLVVTGGTIDAAKGDTLAITGLTDLGATGKFTTTQTDLDLALLDAAKLKVAGADVDTVAFHLNGNTYIYQDNAAADTTVNIVDANDILVKLTGTIDLDTLVLAV